MCIESLIIRIPKLRSQCWSWTHSVIHPARQPNDCLPELPQSDCVSWHRVSLAVIEQLRGVLVAEVEQRHAASNVGVRAADNVARRNVDDIVALVGQKAAHLAILNLQRRPASQEDCSLRDASVLSKRAQHRAPSTLIRRGMPYSSARRRSSNTRLAAVVAPSEYPRMPCGD